jgi:predicted Zn-dependent protease
MLARWSGDTPNSEANLILADAEQFLHRFESATRRLERLLQQQPDQAQAWLMLATLQRVQGRYSASDRACDALKRLRVTPHAEACAAENQALRGQFDAARDTLLALLNTRLDGATRAWLWTTVAELEERAAHPDAAARAWQAALRADSTDGYARLGYADYLLARGEAGSVNVLLAKSKRSDAVLLRQAIAADRTGRGEAVALRSELRARFAQADQRGEPSGHERERALWALEIEADPVRALQAARANVQVQREAVDLWLLARASAAAGDRAALNEARDLARTMGLHDERLLALH